MAELAFGAIERLSHAYIVSAPTQEECLKQAEHIAAAAVCSGAKRPCGLCRHCRKAKAGIHPDIRLVTRLEDEKGNLKKNIVVEQSRELAADACVLPNEAEGKAYIIKDADTMNSNAQNAALKLFEEPPRGVVFILCVTNPAALLPTVRSRCVELSFGGVGFKADGKEVESADSFMKALSTGKPSELMLWCAKNDGMELRRCTAVLDVMQDMTADMLCGRRECRGLDRKALLRLSAIIDRCRGYSKFNVSTKHLFGLLAATALPESETEDR